MTDTVQTQTADILSKFNADKANLITILHEVEDRFGYLPEEAMEAVARYLKLANSSVYATASFYARFRFKPSGRHCLNVCRGTACHVKGAVRVQNEFERQLGVKPGDTTPDGEYTLQTEACFGSCALAPVVVKDGRVYGRVTPTRVSHILRGDA